MAVALAACAAPAAHASLAVPTGGRRTFTGSALRPRRDAASRRRPAAPTTARPPASRAADFATSPGTRSRSTAAIRVDRDRVRARRRAGAQPAAAVGAGARARASRWRTTASTSVNSSAQIHRRSARRTYGRRSTPNTAEFDIVAPGRPDEHADAGADAGARRRVPERDSRGPTPDPVLQRRHPARLRRSRLPAATTSFAGLLFPDPVVTRVVDHPRRSRDDLRVRRQQPVGTAEQRPGRRRRRGPGRARRRPAER